MTLLITVFAAVITTVVWYTRKNDNLRLGSLVFMFWGASLMWLGDAIFEYVEHEIPPSPKKVALLMINVINSINKKTPCKHEEGLFTIIYCT